ncbi:MAG: YcjX family protein, partial [Nitratireductor sp.]
MVKSIGNKTSKPNAKLTSFSDDALIAFDNIQDAAGNLLEPTLRLGVTGLSRAGKTVFISSLIHNLLHGGRLPMFEAQTDGRIAKAEIRPQPSMDLPRFEYEEHIQTLVEDRLWPQSTKAISEIRLTLHFESNSSLNKILGRNTLNIDIVDYPGEWLLDLPLLGMSYEQWCVQAFELSQQGERKKLAKEWHALLDSHDVNAPADEMVAKKMSSAFTQYLRDCRQDNTALSTLPPGRFLMPGDLEGSPALTFAPLHMEADNNTREQGSLHEMMAERYEAYKTYVVKPFFREHFARLDRQIVLVDALQAMNAGSDALLDLKNALGDILGCFRTGKNSLLSSLFSKKIDRILFAATKADHLHHENHDKLEKLLGHIVHEAKDDAQFYGAKFCALGIASVRATVEASVKDKGEDLPVIVGTPLKGENIDGETFNGKTQTAIFPGDLPTNMNSLFKPQQDKDKTEINFVRFRPPSLEESEDGLSLS